MFLLYILFALTVAMILTALFAARIPEQKRGEAFIGFFVVLVLAAWAVDEWLVPAVFAGLRAAWLPVLFLVIFGAIFVVSALLSVRSQGPLGWAGVHHDRRLDAEAEAFDLVLWLAVLVFGIAVIRAIGK